MCPLTLSLAPTLGKNIFTSEPFLLVVYKWFLCRKSNGLPFLFQLQAPRFTHVQRRATIRSEKKSEKKIQNHIHTYIVPNIIFKFKTTTRAKKRATRKGSRNIKCTAYLLLTHYLAHIQRISYNEQFMVNPHTNLTPIQRGKARERRRMEKKLH